MHNLKTQSAPTQGMYVSVTYICPRRIFIVVFKWKDDFTTDMTTILDQVNHTLIVSL